MAHIPSIKRSLAPLANLKKRGKMHFSQAEEISDNTHPVRFTERRFRKDRRRKNIRIMFDRRKTNDRRSHKSLNKPQTNTDRSSNAGQVIDTTA